MHLPAMQTPSTEDIALLVRLVRQDEQGIRQHLQVRQRSVDAFLDWALANQLSSVVLGALEKAQGSGVFPPHGLEALRRRKGEQRVRSRQLLEELERITAHFEAAGQEFLLLKGPYLAARFYGDVYAREFVDIDLLIPGRDRARATRILVEAGYVKMSRTLFGSRLTSRFVHAFDFGNGRSNLDLHWCLSRHPSFRIDEQVLWAHRQRYELGARCYDVLSDEHEIVFAVLSLLRDVERGRPKMKNLIDLLRIVDACEQRCEWTAFFEARRRDGTLGPAVNILGLCLEVTEAHEFLPRLSAALERHGARRVSCRSAAAPLHFAPAAYGLGNKLWCARVYDAPMVTSLFWWAVSLPFRIAVHRLRRGNELRREPHARRRHGDLRGSGGGATPPDQRLADLTSHPRCRGAGGGRPPRVGSAPQR